MQKIYLDHAASTHMTEKALRVLTEASEKLIANASAQHEPGRLCTEKIEACRPLFLEHLGATSTHDLIFTSSATEANNMIFHSLAQDGAEVLASDADHPSITAPAQQPPWQFKKYALSELSDLNIGPNTRLINLTHVNSNNGALLDVESICAQIKSKAPGVHLHLDAAQSFGKLPLDLSKVPVDSVALSAHKMGGPKGISALVIKKGVTLKPLFYGGGHEGGLRASTPSTALIMSWAASLTDPASGMQKAQQLQNQLKEKLKAVDGLIFPSDETTCSPFITTIIHPGIPSDVFLRHLGEVGIFVSSSSACSSKSKGYSPAFAAVGITEEHHKSVMRVSFGHTTTAEEVDTFAENFVSIHKKLIHIGGNT